MAKAGTFLSAVVLAVLARQHSPRAFLQARFGPARSSRRFVQSLDAELGMTEKLTGLVEELRSVPDDRMRFKQLLFLAAQADPMDEALKTAENKVQGCLSLVHVHAALDGGKVVYCGDSDGQMTKGLVAILVKGLSGSTPEDIQKVQPNFIQYAGLGTSLTPGRNNGFINMLAKMKKQAEVLGDGKPLSAANDGDVAAAEVDLNTPEVPKVTSFEEKEDSPYYNIVMGKLIDALEPAEIILHDDSSKHSGDNKESHFRLKIVSGKFAGMPLVKRQQLVFSHLRDEMQVIHAFQMTTKTPEEEGLI